MKTYVLGNGFVAQHLMYPRIVERIEISQTGIEKIFNTYNPEVLINCIGKTGTPNVDWAETNREITSLTNTVLPILLANECVKRNVKLIHIGSGCINYGDPPNRKVIKSVPDGLGGQIKIYDESGWKETDFSNPASFYSKTKYAADLALDGLTKVSTLRIRMPISSRNHSRNLINKLKVYNKVIDIPNSITFMDDLVKCIDHFINNDLSGIYNVVNPQPLTAAKIMQEYQKYVPEHKFDIIDENQLDQLTVAKRSNCILNGEKLQATGFTMSPSQEMLEKTMKLYMENIK